MAHFLFKCGNCKELLQADISLLGTLGVCPYCNSAISLWLEESELRSDYPDSLEDVNIKRLAKAGMNLVVKSPLFGKTQLELCREKLDCIRIFGIDTPVLMKFSRFLSSSGVFDLGKCRNYWSEAVEYNKIQYYLFFAWEEKHREVLIFWFRQMGIPYGELKKACDTLEYKNISFSLPVFIADDPVRLPVENEPTKPFIIQLNDGCPTIRHAKPVLLRIEKDLYPLNSWRSVLVTFVQHIYSVKKAEIDRLRDRPFSDFTEYLILQSKRGNMQGGVEVVKGLWVETHFDANRMLKAIVSIAQNCEFKLNRVAIFYRQLPAKTSAAQTKSSKKTTKKAKSSSRISKNMPLNRDMMDDELVKIRKGIIQDFPEGFVFSSSSGNLLAESTGIPYWKISQKRLQSEMLALSNGTYVFPEMIAGPETMASIIAKVRTYLADFWMFSPMVLYTEFAGQLRNLPKPKTDFLNFLSQFVLPVIGEEIIVVGRGEQQIYASADILLDDPADKEHSDTIVLTEAVHRITSVLEEFEDAVLYAKLERRFFYLHSTLIHTILEDYIDNAVELSIDEMEYWKLVEYFYLPDNFSEELSNIINTIESQNAAPSILTITSALEKAYDSDFLAIYGLTDTDVFKNVISVCYQGEPHKWKHNIFIKTSSGKKGNIIDEFLVHNDKLFYTEDFLNYAKNMRGNKNTSSLICKHLQKKCIRIDANRWISIKEFLINGTLSLEQKNYITDLLLEMLKNEPFLSVSLLPTSFFDQLPTTMLFGTEIKWNKYLFTSIAGNYLKGVKTVNSDVNSHEVTALIVRADEKITNDNVLEFVLHHYKQLGIYVRSVDDIVLYLKKNFVRMNDTLKLRETIKRIWNDNNV